MESLLQNQELLISILKVIAFVFCLFLVVALVFYNWLYLSKILKSNDDMGLRPPRHIHHLVRTCIYIPVFTAAFILAFILLRLY